MENLIACSLADGGVNCGGVFFYNAAVLMALILASGFAALVLLIIGIAYEEKEFKRKMRDLGYVHILGELYGASEKWIPLDKEKEKWLQGKKEWFGNKKGREVP